MQPLFTSITGSSSTSANKTLIQLDFGERVLITDPSQLFTMTYTPETNGFRRVDLIYDVNMGLIFIIGEIRNPLNSTVIRFDVPANVTTDLVGNPNLESSFLISYSPDNAAAAAVGNFMQQTFAVSSIGMMVGTSTGVLPPTALTGSVSRAQTTYLVGQIPMAGMPSTYSGMSNAFSFMSLDFPTPSISTSSDDEKKPEDEEEEEDEEADAELNGEVKKKNKNKLPNAIAAGYFRDTPQQRICTVRNSTQ